MLKCLPKWFIQRIEYFSIDMLVFTDTVCNLIISSFEFSANKGRATFLLLFSQYFITCMRNFSRLRDDVFNKWFKISILFIFVLCLCMYALFHSNKYYTKQFACINIFFSNVEIFDVCQTQLFLYIMYNKLDSNQSKKKIKMISDRFF